MTTPQPPEADRPQYADGSPIPTFIDQTTREAERGENQHTGAIGPEPAEPIPTVTSLSPTGGPIAGGTVVTITGDNLGGSTGVTFAGAAGTAFSVQTETQATVTSPAGVAGAAAVVVQNPAGASTSAVTFTYA